MKVIKLTNLFGIIPAWTYNGSENQIEYNGELYLPLETAKKWYIIRKAWVEEIEYEN